MMYNKLNLGIIFSAIIVLMNISHIYSQCSFLRSTEIRQLARSSFSKKIKKLRQNNIKVLSIVGDREKCEYRTYVNCKNFISDKEWHWAEIITFNSCDQILSYSTSDQAHFEQLKMELIKRHEKIGTRSYNNLDFTIYQRNRGPTLELNEHPNEQGKMFYLINIIK